jgi:hypothetical protein
MGHETEGARKAPARIRGAARKQLRCLWPTLLLAMLAGAVVVASFVPFTPRGSLAEVIQALGEGLFHDNEKPIFTVFAERLIAFLPIGFLLHRQMVLLRHHRPVRMALFAVLVIALIIELGQGLMDGRHPRSKDFLIATLAGGLGVTASVLLHQQLAVAFALVAGNAIAVGLLVVPQFGLEIQDWDCSYPLVLGNEATGDRIWYGSARDIRLYANSLSPGDIRQLAAGQPIDRQPELVLPSFTSAKPRTPGREGACNARDPVLSFRGARVEALCHAIQEAGALAVAMHVRSAVPDQSGPARIIGMSASPFLRNFTIAEESGQIVLRVRTPRNGSNGQLIETRKATQNLERWQHIVATYENGTGRIFIDGEEAVSPRRYYSIVAPVPSLPLSALGLSVAILFGLGVAATRAHCAWPRHHAMAVIALSGLIPVASTAAVNLHFERDVSMLQLAILLFASTCGWVMTFAVSQHWTFLRRRHAE